MSGNQTVDGVSLLDDERCLVKAQTVGGENGPYLVASGAWSRTEDFNDVLGDDIIAGAGFYVQEGVVSGGRMYVLETIGTIVLDTTVLSFVDPDIGATGSSNRAEERFVPTSGQTIFTLALTPVSGTVTFRVSGHPFSELGSYFSLASNVVTWLDVPFALDPDDEVTITYFT